MRGQDYEKDWLAEQLKPPPCPGIPDPRVVHGEHRQGEPQHADGIAVRLAVGTPGRRREIKDTDVQGDRRERAERRCACSKRSRASIVTAHREPAREYFFGFCGMFGS